MASTIGTRHLFCRVVCVINRARGYCSATPCRASDNNDIKRFNWRSRLGWRPFTAIMFGDMQGGWLDDSSNERVRVKPSRRDPPRDSLQDSLHDSSQGPFVKQQRAPSDNYAYSAEDVIKRPKVEEPTRSVVEEVPADIGANADFVHILDVIDKSATDENTLKALTELMRTQNEFKLEIAKLSLFAAHERFKLLHDKQINADFDSIVHILKNKRTVGPDLIKQFTELLSEHNEFKLKMLKMTQAQPPRTKSRKWVIVAIVAIGLIWTYEIESRTLLHNSVERLEGNVRAQQKRLGNVEEEIRRSARR